MEGWVWVTGNALMWRPIKNIANMALGALDVHMRTSQLKGSQGVIEGGVRPIRRIVTGFAGSTKCSIMLVILLVAGVAILGRTLESVDVAAFTGYFNVLTLEPEISQVVVKYSRLPACRTVAQPALHAKFTGVGVIGKMTGFTLGGRVL